jgi:hypothetical protein
MKLLHWIRRRVNDTHIVENEQMLPFKDMPDEDKTRFANAFTTA